MQEIFRLTLVGASRRSDDPVFEQLLRLEAGELAALQAIPDKRERLGQVLERRGLGDLAGRMPELAPGSVEHPFGSLYAPLAVALQRLAGHRVGLASCLAREAPIETHVVFGYEEMNVGFAAARLAMALLGEVCPELGWPGDFGQPIADFPAALGRLRARGQETLFPPDSEALLLAARRRGIPCLKLERFPYGSADGANRVRSNSLLKLGHCRHQRVLDGMLCFDRSRRAFQYCNDRKSHLQLSEKYEFNVPFNEHKYRKITTFNEALDAARSIRFPVVVKPSRRSHGAGLTTGVGNAEALRVAVDRALEIAPAVLVEQHVEGYSYRVLVSNHKLLAVLDASGADVQERAHPDIAGRAVAISRGEEVGLLEMSVVSPDIGRPLEPGGSTAVDVNPAPRLDRILPPGSKLMQAAVEALLDWIYPPGAPMRVPLVAVTGTNGKTTTCRMLARMFVEAGLNTSLVCTDGAYRYSGGKEERWETEGDVRFMQLEDPRTEAVVQEMHFGQIARLGLPWQSCDVGVVTNVTPDHIGRIGVETVEAMAEVKRSVPERAATAVLNADDPLCIGMLPHLRRSRLWLVTQGDDPAPARAAAGPGAGVVLRQRRGDREWLVTDQAGAVTPILPVAEIPATFGGTALHNVSNAQFAIAAGLAAGLAAPVVRRALGGFSMGFEATPGRLNQHDNGRFRVIMDYAHNEDGFRRLMEFVDGLECRGRKLLAFAVSMEVSDQMILDAAAIPAGHFDYYVCKNYSSQDERPPEQVPALMRQSLEGQGVPAAAIVELPNEWEALDHALGKAEEGDLLVVLTGRTQFGKTWERILAA